MEKQKRILGILHIVIPGYFLISALYISFTLSIPFMPLLSISGILAGFVSIPVDYNAAIPIILFLFSGLGIIIGLAFLRGWYWVRTAAIIISVLYLPCLPFGTVLGVYTLFVLSKSAARAFRSLMLQFALVAAVFWYFHWICPAINNYCKQNPKSPKGIGPQISGKSITPLYSTPNLHIRARSIPAEAHATMGLARARQGNTDAAVKELQEAIKTLKPEKGDTSPADSLPTERFNTWLILPLIACAVYFIASRELIKPGQAVPMSFLLMIAVMGLKICIDLSVSLVNGGFFNLGTPISYDLEYYADVPKVNGIWSFLRDFNGLNLSLHSKTHPPGGALFLWIVSKLFNYDLITASFAIIVFSTLTLIPIYLLAKQLYREKAGRYALILCLVTPNIVLFSATSVDAVFTVFLVWSIYLYFRALFNHPIFYGVLTGISLTISMLMNFATTALGVYFIVLAIVTYSGNRVLLCKDFSQDFKRHLTVLLIAGGVVALLYLLLYLGTGYNVFTNLRIATDTDRNGMGTGHETIERYVFLSTTNLFAFFIYIGVPTTALWLREVWKTLREAFRRVSFDSFLIAYVLALIGIAFSTLYTLEVERIWMFMLPFILIPAGKHLAEHIEKHKNLRILYVTLALLWIQILAFEILFDTRW